MRLFSRVAFFLSFFLSLTLFVLSGGRMAQAASPHIVLFILENKGFSQIIGNPDAPFLNQLANNNMVMTNYHAMTHPSLPNYMELISGSSGTSHSDNPSQRFSGPTVLDLMRSKGLTVKGYFEGLPYAGFDGPRYPDHHPVYVQKHNPFMLVPRLRHDPRKSTFDHPLKDLEKDLSDGHLPELAYVVPGLCHDMHGGRACSSNRNAALIRAGDRFMSSWVSKVERSSQWKRGGVILIVWDESGRFFSRPFADRHLPGKGGRVPLICVTSTASGHRTFSEYADHRILLNAILSRFGLPPVANGEKSSSFPGIFLEDRHPNDGTFFYPKRADTVQSQR